MSVLFTDGNSRKTLAAVRSLGKRGIRVTAGDISARNLSSASRYCCQGVAYPSPYTDPEGFQNRLLDLVRHRAFEILIPTSDVTINLINEIRAHLERYVKLPLPNHDPYTNLTDKAKLVRLAQELEVPIPKTVWVQSDAELERVVPKLKYPVVIKPRYSKFLSDNHWVDVLVDYARSPHELTAKYRKIHGIVERPLIQEKIEGPGHGVSVLAHRGNVLAAFGHRRIREKPPSGGVSVVRESVPLDPRLMEYSTRLLSAQNWSGVAMVEFKLDSTDHSPKLMEVNARFWGSLQLAIDSGVDFPFLLYQLVTDGEFESPGPYQAGVRTRWFLGDVDHLLSMWLLPRNKLFLDPGYPSRLKALLDFLGSFKRSTRSEVFRTDDPLPGLWELGLYFREVRKKMRTVLNP
ncbi:MAG: ATP-grasp domain-containing protein [Deltaproteobacteria bacterium]|nr:ATP-grasp domain-containing protein [Deltaproteobacteria bacterium]MBW2259553.1 ATP-grasp domain-containing protein [Deltaproteobacteria bacterium]